ncbi:hypothetical protein AX17_003950 [Amanita inopinata Kibby_2008]|nr:hypothetical protein AX17_003950 [Amanita inopinata Kibby_2008]
MKLVFQTLALFSALCTALPSAHRNGREVVTFAPGGRSSLGAAYFMSNDPSGNYLFAASIEVDATLFLRKAYYAGGIGSHAISIFADALFSQGSIIVSSINNLVILTNAGSGTLTTFRINPENPTLLNMVGDPVPSGGDFPNSIALNTAENVLCAVNTGKINNVNCFTLDCARGLTPLPNSSRSLGFNQTTPPTAPAHTASQIAFTPDDKQLVLTIKGYPASGSLVIWDVNKDGSLSEESKTMVGGLATWTVSFIPGTNALLSADPFIGYDIFDLTAFAANPSTRAQENKIQGSEAVCWSERSPKTGNYYLTDGALSIIYEVEVDRNLSSRVVNEYHADEHDRTIDLSIVSLPEQPDHLYVLAWNSTSVLTYALNGPGQAERIQKLNVGAQAAEVGLSFNGSYVYGMATWVKPFQNGRSDEMPSDPNTFSP